QIADKVPMQRTAIAAPALRIGGAQRQMERAPDFFVEQCVANVTPNVIVRADGKLPKDSRPAVLIKHLDQKVLALGCRAVDDFAAAKNESYVVNLPAGMHCRESELHDALGGVFDWPGEHLAVRQVVAAFAIDPPASRDSEPDVGSIRVVKTNLTKFLQVVGEALLRHCHRRPGPDRVRLVGPTGP